MIKVGIIGCGKIAQVRHIPEYCDCAEASIGGYYDFNFDRAVELAKKHGGKAYVSVEEMLADAEIDAISVCAANNAHAELTLKALNAGKHVLCEKPMATNIADCEAMVEAAGKNGRFLMIGQNQRLTKAHIRAKELLLQGEIGQVISFRTVFGHGGPETWSIDPGKASWFFDPKRAAMGAMADLGIHKTDLIQFLLDSVVVETTAYVGTLDKKDSEGNLIGVDDNAICIYRMKNGAVGTMNASWTFYGAEDNSTVLYGTEGIMRIYDDPTYSIQIIKPDGSRILYDIDRIQTNDHQTRSGIIDAFVDAIVKNREPQISGASVLPAMRAVFGSLESARSKTSVLVNQEA